MNGRAFDAWVASLEWRTGRRALMLGAIASVVIRPRAARGQSGNVQLGEVCTASEECMQSTPCGGPGPVICGDNGLARDGTFNCCVGLKQGCRDDSNCCVGLFCLGAGGFDGCGVPGRCLLPDVVGTIATGFSCTDSSQCNQDDGRAICDDEGVCCSFEGTACIGDIQCCGALSCIKNAPNATWHDPGTCG